MLTFSSASGDPFTALAERESVRMANIDIEILDATSRELIGPDPIDDGNRDGFWVRGDFLEINEAYTEDRIVNDTRRNGLEDLQVGREYILRHLPGEWSWWTKDTLDEVMTYVDRGDLGRCESIKFASAGEHAPAELEEQIRAKRNQRPDDSLPDLSNEIDPEPDEVDNSPGSSDVLDFDTPDLKNTPDFDPIKIQTQNFTGKAL
ncbi:MAG: hypothetical protein Q9190_004391 [Brigantiaea leucoxantha]